MFRCLGAPEDDAAVAVAVEVDAVPGDGAPGLLAAGLGRQEVSRGRGRSAGRGLELLLAQVVLDLLEGLVEVGAAQGADVLGGGLGAGVVGGQHVDQLALEGVDAHLVAVVLRERDGLVLVVHDGDLALGAQTVALERLVVRRDVDPRVDELLELVDDVAGADAGGTEQVR